MFLLTANANSSGTKKKKSQKKAKPPTQLTPSQQSTSNIDPRPSTVSTNQLFESIPNKHGPEKLILNTNHTLEMLEQIPTEVVQEKLDDGKQILSLILV